MSGKLPKPSKRFAALLPRIVRGVVNGVRQEFLLPRQPVSLQCIAKNLHWTPFEVEDVWFDGRHGGFPVLRLAFRDGVIKKTCDFQVFGLGRFRHVADINGMRIFESIVGFPRHGKCPDEEVRMLLLRGPSLRGISAHA